MREKETQAQLAREIEDFKREKERIREIVGRIGAAPTHRAKILNVLFTILVIGCFSAPFIFGGLHLPMIEIALLLISVKIIYLLNNNARQMHFIFWMLSSIEWRLNELASIERKGLEESPPARPAAEESG